MLWWAKEERKKEWHRVYCVFIAKFLGLPLEDSISNSMWSHGSDHNNSYWYPVVAAFTSLKAQSSWKRMDHTENQPKRPYPPESLTRSEAPCIPASLVNKGAWLVQKLSDFLRIFNTTHGVPKGTWTLLVLWCFYKWIWRISYLKLTSFGKNGLKWIFTPKKSLALKHNSPLN